MPDATERIEDPDPNEASATLVELRDGVGPAGDTETERAIVPAKPLRLARFMVDEPEDPA